MILRHIIWLMWATVAVAADQFSCDQETQFEVNGQCCRKCPPGTSMTPLGSCQDPNCKPCDENQYMNTYTTADKCDLQPYCDPNKNFQKTVHESKTEKTKCPCKLGFHCSSVSCITCVPHKTCGPGHGAVTKGDQNSDTACQKCPEGTFSNETSWDGVCKKHTVCEAKYQIEKAGTDTSDTHCVPSRNHIVIAVLLPLIGAAFIVAIIFWCVCRGKSGNVKSCVESCWGDKQTHPKEGVTLLVQPVDQNEHIDPPTLPSQEEGSRGIPEENEDADVTSDVIFSDNGNFVTQEDGKKEIISRQESQTQTYID